MGPSFRITTREQTCSTTSRTCELKTTILPGVGKPIALKRLQHTCRAHVEAGKRLVEDDERGLCSTAAAMRIFCRIPFRYADSVW